ncbi:30S ribosomal protein S11-like [Haliotis rubra]|uniref:30S ribosomal protein S11-like n=1 Tax=Haliotis rubra TaxID=36100 RepID=UPI001EE5408A|nr:30S ribosomal protein S11-like [Haliotis rubra]
MFRSVLIGLRRPFTCVVPLMRLQPVCPGGCGQTAVLHSSPLLTVLDKDNRHKKFLLAQKTEPLSGDENIEVEEFRPGSVYPTMETAGMLVDGVRFDKLHIVHVKATHNNTIVTLTNGEGMAMASESGGSVGFRNTRKGTNVAGQAAALALGEKGVSKGVTKVRVSIKGIGPGRMPALKGLQMAGLTVVSITDATPLPFNGNRPA